jgi:hypothetical protein
VTVFNSVYTRTHYVDDAFIREGRELRTINGKQRFGWKNFFLFVILILGDIPFKLDLVKQGMNATIQDHNKFRKYFVQGRLINQPL